MGLPCTISKIKCEMIKCEFLQKISQPNVFNAPTEEFPWNFVTVWGQKTRMMAQKCHNSIVLCMYCMLMHDKKHIQVVILICNISELPTKHKKQPQQQHQQQQY